MYFSINALQLEMWVSSELTFRESVVELIKAGEFPFEEIFIFSVYPLEISINISSHFGQ